MDAGIAPAAPTLQGDGLALMLVLEPKHAVVLAVSPAVVGSTADHVEGVPSGQLSDAATFGVVLTSEYEQL
jgi:hypothetical protein